LKTLLFFFFLICSPIHGNNIDVAMPDSMLFFVYSNTNKELYVLVTKYHYEQFYDQDTIVVTKTFTRTSVNAKDYELISIDLQSSSSYKVTIIPKCCGAINCERGFTQYYNNKDDNIDIIRLIDNRTTLIMEYDILDFVKSNIKSPL